MIEKETLAIHWPMQRLRTFIWGRRFTVRTDHKPLTSILTTKGFASDRTSQRVNKGSTLLLEYNFDIQYIPGVNNTAADCMSRLPLQYLEEDFTDDDIYVSPRYQTLRMVPYLHSNFKLLHRRTVLSRRPFLTCILSGQYVNHFKAICKDYIILTTNFP